MAYNDPIYINGRFLSHPMTGIPRFSYEMCRAMHVLGLQFTVVAPGNVLPCYEPAFNVIRYGSLKSHAWEQVDLYRFLRKRGNPLLLSFSGLGPVYYKNHIATIHDIAFMRHPEWFSGGYNRIYKFMTPILAKKAGKILTVSRFSAGEIASCLRIDNSKIEVVYNALSEAVCCDDREKETALPFQGERYILAVSSHDPRKNFVHIVRAFKALRLPGLKLYIVGNVSSVFRKDNLNEWLDGDVRVLGHVSDEELSCYYRHASLFLYPSLYEGFGIPPLEAMSNACPVLVSDIPALKEVYGDSVAYCDPYSIESIASQTRRLLDNEEERQELREKGARKIREYSWERSARKVMEIIHNTK